MKNAVRNSGLSSTNNDVIINCAGKPKESGCFGGEPLIPNLIRAVAETMREVGLKRFLNQMVAVPHAWHQCHCGPLVPQRVVCPRRAVGPTNAVITATHQDAAVGQQYRGVADPFVGISATEAHASAAGSYIHAVLWWPS